jgi:hypothetical protein
LRAISLRNFPPVIRRFESSVAVASRRDQGENPIAATRWVDENLPLTKRNETKPTMKNAKTLWRMTALVGVTIGAIALTGCASRGYVKADSAADSLRTAAEKIHAENQNLKLAVGHLDGIVNRPSSDLRQQFHYYDEAVDRLYDSVEQAEKAVRHSEAKSEQYFAAWDKQLAAMNYEAVQSRGQTRRIAVSNQLEKLSRQYRETREAVLPLLAYLEDIRKSLSSDLTSGGLESMKEVVANAQAGSEKVQIALEGLVNGFTSSGSALSSAFPHNAQLAPTSERTAASANGTTPQ